MAITVTYDIKHGARLFNKNEETSLVISIQELEAYLGEPKRSKTCYIWDITEKDMVELLDFIDNLPMGRIGSLRVGIMKESVWLRNNHDSNNDQHLYTSRNKKVRKREK